VIEENSKQKRCFALLYYFNTAQHKPKLIDQSDQMKSFAAETDEQSALFPTSPASNLEAHVGSNELVASTGSEY
jgi:hypothetical protein